MLKLKPACESCSATLAADSLDAYICSMECTFCKDCYHNKVNQTCPNCGGELVRRPTRSAALWEKYPPLG